MTSMLPLLLMTLAAGPLAAQAIPETAYGGWHPPDPASAVAARPMLTNASRLTPPPADGVALGLAGLVGSAAGVLGGGYLGYHIDRADGRCSEWCGFSGMFLGAAIGSAVLAPVAVHAANGGRGNLETTLFTSVVITGAGAVVALMTNSAEVLVAVPVAAIISSVALERSTTPASE